MTALFADTFYWIALADSADSAHQRAVNFTAEPVTVPDVLQVVQDGYNHTEFG
jgi:predicted nucleic acid-binding protein